MSRWRDLVRGISLAAAAAAAGAGCTGPASEGPFAAAPAEPIAFVLRNVQETARLVDEAEARENVRVERGEVDQEVVLRGVERLGRDEQESARDQQGRVALYVLPDSSLTFPESLARGARPLDWAADHSRLLFSWTQRGTIQLFEWILPSGEVRQLTTAADGALDGGYGPDHSLVWVQVDSDGALRLWMRAPGAAPRPLTAGPRDVQPAWSPDGERVVYTRFVEGAPAELAWVEPATGRAGSYGRGRSAAFSPDGTWLVFVAETRAGSRLWRMRADGTGRRPFGESGYEENDPSFSPDGRFVVFAASKTRESPVSRLFVRTLDGANDRQLEFAGSGLLPAW